MPKIIKIHLSDKEVAELEEIAAKEKLDRSALVRSFVLHQLEEYKMKESARLYQKGIISLQEAATSAEVSIYKMMEYIQRRKYPSTYTNKRRFQILLTDHKNRGVQTDPTVQCSI